MDVVLGVSMASSTVQMVLVEGENADGVTVEQDAFSFPCDDKSANSNAPRRVLGAILGTMEGAAESGHHLRSIGVTWSDDAEAAVLRDALAGHKITNFTLVSPLLAAAALAQTVGSAVGYNAVGLLFLEPDSATVAVVDSADGAVTEVRKQPMQRTGGVVAPAAMLSRLCWLETPPDGVFLVGSGVDVAQVKPQLEVATTFAVSAPEDPDTALARGAALASANTPLFVSSTAALAYAQDPGTGEVCPAELGPEYVGISRAMPDDVMFGDEPLAYSAVPDDRPDDPPSDRGAAEALSDNEHSERKPLLLAGSALATVLVVGVVALVVSLAVDIRPTVGLRPEPEQRLIVPTQPASPPQAQAPVPAPPVQTIPQPAPVVHEAPPAAVAAPPPPAAPPPAVPAAPPPPVPAPAAPVPVPVPVLVPIAPVHLRPAAPVQLPALPTPPVHVPTPRVKLPKPPAQAPVPPVKAPTPTPPVHVPTPTPPVERPTPPKAPTPAPPVQLPTPPVKAPKPQPPVQVPTRPVQVPAPKPPIQIPSPKAPPVLDLPVPASPPVLDLPAPAAPKLPSMPQMPSSSMPHFSFGF